MSVIKTTLTDESILRTRAAVIEAICELERKGVHETSLILELCLAESWLRGLLEEFGETEV